MLQVEPHSSGYFLPRHHGLNPYISLFGTLLLVVTTDMTLIPKGIGTVEVV